MREGESRAGLSPPVPDGDPGSSPNPPLRRRIAGPSAISAIAAAPNHDAAAVSGGSSGNSARPAASAGVTTTSTPWRSPLTAGTASALPSAGPRRTPECSPGTTSASNPTDPAETTVHLTDIVIDEIVKFDGLPCHAIGRATFPSGRQSRFTAMFAQAYGDSRVFVRRRADDNNLGPRNRVALGALE